MTQYLSFLAAGGAALLVPGPDTLVVLRTSLTGGPALGTWAAAGSAAGLLAWGAAAVAGIATLLTLSPLVFGALKLAGAAYLCALGLQALRAAWRGDAIGASDHDATGSLAPRAAFRRGLLSDLANVKVGLFWTALVPQFLAAGEGDKTALAVAMAVSMPAIAFAWLAGYAAVAGRLGQALSAPRFARAVNYAAGVTMVALAAGLAVASQG